MPKPAQFPGGAFRTIMSSADISKYRCSASPTDHIAMDQILKLLPLVPPPNPIGDYGCPHDILNHAWCYLYNREVAELTKGVPMDIIEKYRNVTEGIVK